MASQTSEHLSVEELQRIANKAIRQFTSQIEKTGQLDASIVMVMPDDSLAALPFPPEIMNIGFAKRALFMAMREFALQKQAKAVIFSSDTFVHDLSDEEKERIKTDKEFAEHYRNMALDPNASIDKMVAGGIGRKVEAIIVTVQSPLYDLMVTQHYERRGADQRHILLGEQITMDSSKGKFAGHFKVWDRGENAEIERRRRGEESVASKPQ